MMNLFSQQAPHIEYKIYVSLLKSRIHGRANNIGTLSLPIDDGV